MKSLAAKNLKGKPLRTAVLVILSALLTFTVFGGTVIVESLDTGLASLENRLGADIMVVPYEAATQKKFEDMVLQGSTGYFYMDSSKLEMIKNTEGVKRVSPQFFLASTSSSCCSVAVQIIGFEPETDFTVTPWIKKSYGKDLEKLDVVVGNDLNAFVGDELSFYGVKCKVAAKLDKTGTGFDTAVFTTEETIKELIRSSLEKKMNDFKDIDPENSVSCIMIDVADGYTAEEVLNDINLHVKRVKAIQSAEMISGVSDSLSGVAGIIRILMTAIWVLGIVILLLAFTLSVNERRKEFAVLRVIGATRARLGRTVICEALIACLSGGAAGICLGILIILPFNDIIEQMLGLPFLLPDAVSIIKYVIIAVILSALSAVAASGTVAARISRIDTGVILRGDN